MSGLLRWVVRCVVSLLLLVGYYYVDCLLKYVDLENHQNNLLMMKKNPLIMQIFSTIFSSVGISFLMDQNQIGGFNTIQTKNISVDYWINAECKASINRAYTQWANGHSVEKNYTQWRFLYVVFVLFKIT